MTLPHFPRRQYDERAFFPYEPPRDMMNEGEKPAHSE